ncbi:MAG: hypothetical protein WAK93_07125 [Solirubrobacteraceae bacterium]
MSGEEPKTEELKRQQLEVEQAEREALPESETEAAADRHLRRADKAAYLREKLQEQQNAEEEAESDG